MAATDRRTFVAGALGLAVLPAGAVAAPEAAGLYGLIGKMRAVPGRRDELLAIMLEGTATMPGCLAYIVAKDRGDPDSIWITEAWDNPDSHRASLRLPAVRAAIARGRPLIAGFESSVEIEPVGGIGLAARSG